MKQETFVDDGFAIWLEGTKTRSDIHIYEWLNPKVESNIDIGIRVYDADMVNRIGVFFPFDVNKTEIIDLSAFFENKDIAEWIFNSTCDIRPLSNMPIIEIKYKNREENIIRLTSSNVCIEKYDSGTLVYFNISFFHRILTKNEIYLRFRIPHKSLNRFRIHHKSLKDLFLWIKQSLKSLFESPVIKYQYNYFMRINEIRSLPEEIIRISKITEQDIQRVRVLIFCNNQYDIDKRKCYKVRQLEEHIASYVPDKFDCNNVITYHWVKRFMKDYNFYFIIENEYISKKSLCIYAVIVIILSIIENILWEKIK